MLSPSAHNWAHISHCLFLFPSVCVSSFFSLWLLCLSTSLSLSVPPSLSLSVCYTSWAFSKLWPLNKHMPSAFFVPSPPQYAKLSALQSQHEQLHLPWLPHSSLFSPLLSPSASLSLSLLPLAFHCHSLLISRTISVAAAALLLVARFFVCRIILHSSCCMQQMRQACMPPHTAHPTGLTKCNIFSYAYTILIGYSPHSPPSLLASSESWLRYCSLFKSVFPLCIPCADCEWLL